MINDIVYLYNPNWLVDDAIWEIKDKDATFTYFDWKVNTDDWVIHTNIGE